MEAVAAMEAGEGTVADAAVLLPQDGLVEAVTATEAGEGSVAYVAVL